MYLIAGLGNPGARYENTWHNMGFRVVDILGSSHAVKIKRIKFRSLVGEGEIAGEKVLLLKPQTYMNLSGNAIREAVGYYKLEMDRLIVIYDDIDLPQGTIRIREQGSAGTHNGMKSIIYDIRRDDFIRVRIGIGRDQGADLAEYVTSEVPKAAGKVMEPALQRAAEAVEMIIKSGVDRAMGEYNG